MLPSKAPKASLRFPRYLPPASLKNPRTYLGRVPETRKEFVGSSLHDKKVPFLRVPT